MPKQTEDQLEKVPFVTEVTTSPETSEQTVAKPDMEESSMKKPLLIIFIILILAGIAFAGWTFFTLNNKNNSSQTLDSPVSQTITKAPASLTLELEQPDDNGLSFQSSIIVSGNTRPNSSIMITSQSTDTVIQSKSDGSFSTVLNLDVGVNNVNVAVFDDTGDQRTAQRTIYYSKDKI